MTDTADLYHCYGFS
ncbi:hypothetical protein D018_1950A, partial [Vibrio parahaemolyticus VP2007-007]